jgi:hypothetical protein
MGATGGITRGGTRGSATAGGGVNAGIKLDSGAGIKLDSGAGGDIGEGEEGKEGDIGDEGERMSSVGAGDTDVRPKELAVATNSTAAWAMPCNCWAYFNFACLFIFFLALSSS